ncbi:MAG: hypothetical protein U0324_38615 [Polyangiales bacterium]
MVTSSADNTARVWRADGTGEPVVLRGHEGQVLRAAFSPDGVYVVTASVDSTVRVWRARGSGEPVVLRGRNDHPDRAAFSPDGAYVVASSDDNAARADGTGGPWSCGGTKAA